LRKVAAFLEQERSASRQSRFENARVIPRHEPVLPSPNKQGRLTQCPHDGLQGRGAATSPKFL
jgi:hypothetical protein